MPRGLTISLVTVAALCSGIAAWANAFKRFYEALPVVGVVPLASDTAEPKVARGAADLNQERALMWQKGYQLIGFSSFEGPWQSDKDALKFAKRVHAGYVIINAPRTGTREGTHYYDTSHTDYSPISVNVTGRYGQSIGTASGTLTTRWTETQAVPYSISIYSYSAGYYALVEKRGSGLLVRRRDNGTDGCLEVLAVREGSPGDQAGIVAGDVINLIDGLPAKNEVMFDKAITAARDAPLLITLSRDGATSRIAMAIPPEWRVSAVPDVPRH